MRFKVGCCGFPVSMREYMKKFDVVEVQRTFYRLPSPETAEKWRKMANTDFEFIIKANQVITHPPTSPTYRKAGIKAEKGGFFQPSKEVFDAWEKTLEIANILRSERILFQTPPSFKFSEENVNNMVQFFSTVEEIEPIWEPRGWSEQELMRIRDRIGDRVIHCVDPLVSKPFFGKNRYFRLHGKYEGGRIVYSHKYSDAELKKLGDIVRSDQLKSKYDFISYTMFNNKYMLEDALKFKNLFFKDFS